MYRYSIITTTAHPGIQKHLNFRPIEPELGSHTRRRHNIKDRKMRVNAIYYLRFLCTNLRIGRTNITVE